MSARKPPGLGWESWIDRQVREAEERGEFDDLPGAGKPTPGLDKPFDELWWVKDKLRQSGLGLSGGQQQRLCVARGIAVKPEVLLLDEPASALDPLSTRKLEETIVELKHEYTIVIVTHNLQQATRVSDNTGFMYLGRLIEFGNTDQVFLAPSRKIPRRLPAWAISPPPSTRIETCTLWQRRN